MRDNLQWLFYAFGAGWLIHMAYLFSISHRERGAVKQIEELRKLLKDGDT